MSIIQFNPLTDMDEVKNMLQGKDDFLRIFINAVENNNLCTYIARYNNEPAGILSLNRYDSRRTDMNVYVAEKYRRRRIGTKLVLSADRFISDSIFEHAYCTFTADEGAAEFLTRQGFRSYCSFFDMERSNTLIDSDKLNDASLLEKGIVIRNYKDDDYPAWHNISDVAFFLLREKLGLTPSYYLPLSESERGRLARDSANRYIMIVNGVATAVGAVKNNRIHLLAVRPDLQRHGYGRMMASYLNNEIILKRHAEKVYISVIAGNPAKRLYEKLGFRDILYSYEYIKQYKPDSRPKAPEGNLNEAAILNELKIHGRLREDSYLISYF